MDATNDGLLAAIYAVDTESTDDEWHVTIHGADAAPIADLLTIDLVNDVAVSPDGTRVALPNQRGQVQLISFSEPAAATQVVRLVGPDPLLSVAYSPDGSTLVTGDAAGQVGIWDGTTLDPVRRWRGHTGIVSSVLATDDGRIVSSDGQSVASWSKIGNSLTREILGVKGDVMAVAMLDDERLMAAAENGFQLVVGPLDETLTPLGERLQYRVMSIDVSDDGTTVATGDAAGRVVVRDTTTLSVVHELSVGDNVVLDHRSPRRVYRRRRRERHWRRHVRRRKRE